MKANSSHCVSVFGEELGRLLDRVLTYLDRHREIVWTPEQAAEFYRLSSRPVPAEIWGAVSEALAKKRMFRALDESTTRVAKNHQGDFVPDEVQALKGEVQARTHGEAFLAAVQNSSLTRDQMASKLEIQTARVVTLAQYYFSRGQIEIKRLERKGI